MLNANLVNVILLNVVIPTKTLIYIKVADLDNISKLLFKHFCPTFIVIKCSFFNLNYPQK
jgi:hypothetical protein